MSYPRIDLDGAVVVVTGGGRGIGQAAGELFAEKGATVCLGDLDLDAATSAAAGIGARAHPYVVDVASRESYAAFIEDVLRTFGQIDVLVNNAGVMPLGDFLAESPVTSRTTFDVNVWGLINGMQLVMPHMIERGRGHVVNVASLAGKMAAPGMAVYNASKFAAVGLSAAVRVEYADTGVSVSAVLPTAVRTRLTSGVPLGRGLPTVDAEDIAEAIVASVRSRKAEIPVPGYLAAIDLIQAAAPEPVMRLARRVLGDRRGLEKIDAEARGAYDDSIAAQAALRSAHR